MPLTTSGPVIGAAILAAIGNVDPAAVLSFTSLATTIGVWCASNINCLPGTMVRAGTAVAGQGLLTSAGGGGAADLGPKLAVAMGDPSENGVTTWTRFATALIAHMEAFGSVNPASFVSPAGPSGGPLTGTGLVAFASVVFAPPLSTQLGVSEPVAAAMLEVFGAQILTQIAATAVIVPATVMAPLVPYTSAADGAPIVGAGAIT
jgi:hypothetical protein